MDFTSCNIDDNLVTNVSMTDISLYHVNKYQDEKFDMDDKTVLLMYNVSEAMDAPTVYARLTPKHVSKDGLKQNDDAFLHWLQVCGNDYLKIDATTLQGQKDLAKANNIAVNDEYWKQPIHVTYMDLFFKIQINGVKDGWSCAAEEGMHRYTSTISMFLCGLLNRLTGYLTLNSIKKVISPSMK